MGYSKEGHLGVNENYDNLTKFDFSEEDGDERSKEVFVDVSSGKHFTLYVTESGKLYGSGNRFMKEIGLDCDQKII